MHTFPLCLYIRVRKTVTDCIVMMTCKPLACLLVASFCSVSLKCSTPVWVWIVKLQSAHQIHLVLPIVTLRKITYSRALHIGSKPVQRNRFNEKILTYIYHLFSSPKHYPASSLISWPHLVLYDIWLLKSIPDAGLQLLRIFQRTRLRLLGKSSMKCPECWQPLWDKCPSSQSKDFPWHPLRNF